MAGTSHTTESRTIASDDIGLLLIAPREIEDPPQTRDLVLQSSTRSTLQATVTMGHHLQDDGPTGLLRPAITIKAA